MNQFEFMGRATRDPEVRYTQSDTSMAVARFTLAINRLKSKDGAPKADFFNIVAFGKTAENCEKYVKKGSKIVVTGTVANNNYTDSDGNKRYNTDFIAHRIYFCEKKSDDDNLPEPAPEMDADGFMNIPEGIDEELPFS